MRLGYKQILGLAACGSASLGFVRGYKITKYNAFGYENLYVDRVKFGLVNTFMYVNPVFILPILSKEVTRMEIKLRKLDPKLYPHVYEEFFTRDYTDVYIARINKEKERT